MKLTFEEKERRKAERIAKEKRKQEIHECALRILDNDEAIIEEINKEFLQQKQEIADTILAIVKGYFDDPPVPHYEWRRGDIPWDSSGELVYICETTPKITLADFLEEYTGNWEATYESGCGQRFLTYSDDISFETLNIGGAIMLSVLNRYIPDDYSESERFDLRDEIYDHFYDNTFASDFFWTECTLEFLGKDIIDPGKSIEELVYKKACE